MTRFIKLTNIIINTSSIIKINILPTKYTMFMSNNYLEGFIFLGSGSIESNSNTIDVCKNKDPTDYQIVKEWINKINSTK